MKYTASFIRRYYQPLMDKIYKYAYENAEVEPYIERRDVIGWSGRVYEVSKIEKELHSDIIEDLIDMGYFYNIKLNCDKYVILPDIFSNRNYPLFKHRNEFDTGRRSITIINGKTLDLFEKGKTVIKYNHNGKLYYFYKGSEFDEVFNGNNKIEQVIVGDMAYIYNPSDGTWWENSRFHFNIGINGEIFNVITGNLGSGHLGKDAILGASPSTAKGYFVSISFMAPYIKFEYDKKVDPTLYIEVPGLMSFTEDGWVMEKTGNHDFNSVYIHNRNVLFSNTALIIYKDQTWNTENFRFGKSKYVSKIDKHTIKMGKFDNIKEVYIFTRPFNFKNYERVDTIYDDLMKINSHGFLAMKKYKKTTTNLANMISNKEFTLKDAIEYGYKYDLDVLKVIQNYFKLVHTVDLKNISIVKEYNNETFYTPKWIIPITNRLDLYPSVFINDMLISSDLKIQKSIDKNILIFDPLELMKRYTNFNYNDMDNYIKKRDLKFSIEFFNKYVKSVTIVLTDTPIIDDVPMDPKLYRSPIYHNELIYDKYIKSSATFVNGRLSSDIFSYDKNGNISSKYLMRYLDGVERFDFDKNIKSFENTLNPSKYDLYHPLHTLEDGNFSIYENDNDLSLLINRLEEPLLGVCKLYLGKKYTFRHNHNNFDTLMKFDFNTFKEKSTIHFDKYGFLANDLINVLSSNMINLTNAYNYRHFDELTDDTVIHTFSPKLRNSLLDVDFEINPDLIDKVFNIGSFNDNVANDLGIQQMFEPMIMPIIKDIPIKLKTLEKLYGEKVLTKYWLSTLGNPYDMERYKNEIKIFNGKYISIDGKSLGNIPEINRNFIDNTTDGIFGTFPHSLNTLFASNSSMYNIVLNSNQNTDKSIITIPDGYVNLNKMDYKINLNDIYLHYLKEDTNTYVAKLRMNIDLPPQAINL